MEDHKKSITVNIQELTQALAQKIDDPNRRLIAETIIKNLETTSVGINHLVLALVGIEAKLKYKIGQFFLCQAYNLSSWRMNKELNKEKGIIDENGMIKVRIIQVNELSDCPYKVSYSYFSKEDADEPDMIDEYHVHEDALVPFPEEDERNVLLIE